MTRTLLAGAGKAALGVEPSVSAGGMYARVATRASARTRRANGRRASGFGWRSVRLLLHSGIPPAEPRPLLRARFTTLPSGHRALRSPQCVYAPVVARSLEASQGESTSDSGGAGDSEYPQMTRPAAAAPISARAHRGGPLDSEAGAAEPVWTTVDVRAGDVTVWVLVGTVTVRLLVSGVVGALAVLVGLVAAFVVRLVPDPHPAITAAVRLATTAFDAWDRACQGMERGCHAVNCRTEPTAALKMQSGGVRRLRGSSTS